MRLNPNKFVDDSVRNVQHTFRWQPKRCVAVGKASNCKLSLFSDIHAVLHPPVGHPCDPFCCTHPRPLSECDTLTSFSDLTRFHPTTELLVSTLLVAHIRGTLWRLKNQTIDFFRLLQRDVPPCTQSRSCSSVHVSQDWGEIFSQRTRPAGWEEEVDGGVHCLPHLWTKGFARNSNYSPLFSCLLAAIYICSYPTTAALKALIWVTGCRMASQHSGKPSPRGNWHKCWLKSRDQNKNLYFCFRRKREFK